MKDLISIPVIIVLIFGIFVLYRFKKAARHTFISNLSPGQKVRYRGKLYTIININSDTVDLFGVSEPVKFKEIKS